MVRGILLFGVLLIGGAAVDISDTLHAEKRLRLATDAAALAAAAELPDADAARIAAVDYMKKNLTDEFHSAVVSTADIRIGNWDSERGRIVDDETRADAVRVVARHANQVGYAILVQNAFLRLAGFEGWTVRAESTAVKPGDCAGLRDAEPSAGCAADGHSIAALMQ